MKSQKDTDKIQKNQGNSVFTIDIKRAEIKLKASRLTAAENSVGNQAGKSLICIQNKNITIWGSMD